MVNCEEALLNLLFRCRRLVELTTPGVSSTSSFALPACIGRSSMFCCVLHLAERNSWASISGAPPFTSTVSVALPTSA